jgi:hypothetical protein
MSEFEKFQAAVQALRDMSPEEQRGYLEARFDAERLVRPTPLLLGWGPHLQPRLVDRDHEDAPTGDLAHAGPRGGDRVPDATGLRQGT